MIVLSQDKDKIVNFDNLTQVYITQDEEKSAYYWHNFSSSDFNFLGDGRLFI